METELTNTTSAVGNYNNIRTAITSTASVVTMVDGLTITETKKGSIIPEQFDYSTLNSVITTLENETATSTTSLTASPAPPAVSAARIFFPVIPIKFLNI